MAIVASEQPFVEASPLIMHPGHTVGESSYASKLQPSMTFRAPWPLTNLTYLHGEPRVIWKEKEVEHIIVNEDLEFVVVENLHTYG